MSIIVKYFIIIQCCSLIKYHKIKIERTFTWLLRVLSVSSISCFILATWDLKRQINALHLSQAFKINLYAKFKNYKYLLITGIFLFYQHYPPFSRVNIFCFLLSISFLSTQLPINHTMLKIYYF